MGEGTETRGVCGESCFFPIKIGWGLVIVVHLVYDSAMNEERDKDREQELLGEIYSDDSIPYNVEGDDQEEEDHLAPKPWEVEQLEEDEAQMQVLIQAGVPAEDARRIVDDGELAVFNEGRYRDKEVGTHSIFGFIHAH